MAPLRNRVLCSVSTRAWGPKGVLHSVLFMNVLLNDLVSSLESAGAGLPVAPVLFSSLLLVFKASFLLPDVSTPCFLFAGVATPSRRCPVLFLDVIF